MNTLTNKEKIKLLIGAIINIVIFGLEVFCLVIFIKYAVNGNTDIRFRYYTNISNLLVGFIALPNAIFLLISLAKSKIIYPKILSIIKYCALCMIALTFLTVIFILVPLTSFKEMYSDLKFITHLIAPVLALGSYLFLEEKTLFKWKISLLALVPTFIYSVVYITSVVYLKTWPDLYQINKQGLWFIYSPLENIIGFGISQGLYFLKKITSKIK